MNKSKQIKYKQVQVEYSEDYTSCKIYIDKKEYDVPFGTKKRFDEKYGFTIMVPQNKRITINLIYTEFNKWVNNVIWKGKFGIECPYGPYYNLYWVLLFLPKHEKQLITYKKLLISHVNAKLTLFDYWYNNKKIFRRIDK